jgi:RimJ/RimL family protein N-acetyltransferase
MNWKILEGKGYSTVEWSNLGRGIRQEDILDLLAILGKIPVTNKVSVAVPFEEGEEGSAERILKEKGFQKVKEREVFARSLKDIIEFPETPFTFIPENESSAIRCLSSILGSQKEAGFILKALHEEIDQGKYCIYTAMMDGKDAGVVLSHIEPFTVKEGRLFYFGVTPEFQGKGLAALLHRFALASLRMDLNAETYIGVTDGGNQAMKQVFLRNGCAQLHSIRIFSR